MFLLFIALVQGSMAESFYPERDDQVQALQRDASWRQNLARYLQRVVVAVVVEGNTDLSDEQIIRQAKLLTRPHYRTEISKLETDMKSIFALGSFEDVQLDIAEEKNGIRVIYRVRENARVKSIVFQGNTVFTKDKLLGRMQTTGGQILNFKRLEADIGALDNRYHRLAYDLAHVEHVSFDPETGQLLIHINEVEIEEIMITGNHKTREHVILREMRSRPGRVYNSVQLRTDRDRILALGFFSNVFSPELVPGSESNKIKLLLRVKEQKVNALNFGAGFSETEPWFLFVNLGFKNPFGTGEEINFKSQFSDVKKTYSAQYYHPWMFRSPTKFTGALWNTLAQEELNLTGENPRDIDVSRVGWSTKLTYPFDNDFQISLIYKSEGVKEVTGNSTEIDYQNNSLALAALYSALRHDRHKYVVGGSAVRFKAEQGGQLLNLYSMGGVQFERYDLGVSIFSSLFSFQDVLGLRLLGGIYRPEDPDRPILEGDQYLVGGATTLRGVLDNSASVEKGSRMIVANLEYRHTFADFLQGVLFMDWGDAFEQGDLEWKDFLVSKGVGIRLTISGFTLRFDMGWYNNNPGILHFSLGQMF